jgi:HSP20 family molecular chaperone IbpA
MKQNNSPEKKAFDPPVRLSDTGGELLISIGLPGVSEEQIRLDLDKTTFTVAILDHDKPVKKTIRIPKGAHFFKKKFSDGFLEIFFKKPTP